MVLLKKTDYATEITSVKNDYVTKVALKKVNILLMKFKKLMIK